MHILEEVLRLLLRDVLRHTVLLYETLLDLSLGSVAKSTAPLHGVTICSGLGRL